MDRTMKNDDSPRVIVVTGASAGLGRAIVKGFAETEQACKGRKERKKN
jgi:NAD(P)-dependent dehydrogenase (short-subunit alcohol dehydrogenase family)